MYKINYQIKSTTSGTDYLSIDQKDNDTLMTTILSVMTYMQELSISRNKDIKEFVAWFNKPNKRFLYNTKLERHNSPQSLLAGVINNIQFGTQHDFSLIQLEAVQDIVNTSIDIIEAIKDAHNISLQKKPLFTKIFIQPTFFTQN